MYVCLSEAVYVLGVRMYRVIPVQVPWPLSCECTEDYPAVFGSLAELRVFVSSQAEYVCFLCV